LLGLLGVLLLPAVVAGRVSYLLRIPTPAHGLLELSVALEAKLPLEVAMPAWSPGSYRERL
jgi:hypothetical protein